MAILWGFGGRGGGVAAAVMAVRLVVVLRRWSDPLWMVLRLPSVCPFRILAAFLLLRRGDLIFA